MFECQLILAVANVTAKIAITGTNAIQKSVRECFEKLYSSVVKYQDNGSIAEYK